jgi:adiponectin receptor
VFFLLTKGFVYVHFRHLIGFFIFLALTIYTATQVPNVVDIQSLQHLPDVLRKADIHKIQAELVSCLPSLPHLSDLQKLKDELKSSWNSMEVLPSLSRWHLLELLASCLPQRFTHPNETSLSVLVSSLQLAELLDHILLL